MVLASLASFRLFDWHRVETNTYEIRCIENNGLIKPGIEVVTPSGTYFRPTDVFGCEDKKQAASGTLACAVTSQAYGGGTANELHVAIGNCSMRMPGGFEIMLMEDDRVNI